jgi:hypothetical protein
LNRIVADLFDAVNVDILFTDLQHFLTRTMTLHLSGRRIDSQVFDWQVEATAVIEGDLQYMARLMQVNFGWFG